MKFSSEEVQKIAGLANLKLDDEEQVLYGTQLSGILEYVEQIERCDTEGVEPVFNVTGRVSVMREDQIKPSLSQDEATVNGKVEGGFFVTKGVFEEE